MFDDLCCFLSFFSAKSGRIPSRKCRFSHFDSELFAEEKGPSVADDLKYIGQPFGK